MFERSSSGEREVTWVLRLFINQFDVWNTVKITQGKTNVSLPIIQINQMWISSFLCRPSEKDFESCFCLHDFVHPTSGKIYKNSEPTKGFFLNFSLKQSYHISDFTILYIKQVRKKCWENLISKSGSNFTWGCLCLIGTVALVLGESTNSPPYTLFRR